MDANLFAQRFPNNLAVFFKTLVFPILALPDRAFPACAFPVRVLCRVGAKQIVQVFLRSLPHRFPLLWLQLGHSF